MDQRQKALTPLMPSVLASLILAKWPLFFGKVEARGQNWTAACYDRQKAWRISDLGTATLAAMLAAMLAAALASTLAAMLAAVLASTLAAMLAAVLASTLAGAIAAPTREKDKRGALGPLGWSVFTIAILCGTTFSIAIYHCPYLLSVP